jgi:hypothetical protein
VSKHFKPSRVGLAICTTESVNRGSNMDIDEATFFDQTLPACTRQATGNSGGPKVNVGNRGFRYRLSVGDIGKLQMATRSQYPFYFREYLLLVGA